MFKKKPCPICIEKEKRIEDLLTQIEMLRSLALPRNSATPTYVALEADETACRLTGRGHFNFHKRARRTTQQLLDRFQRQFTQCNR